MPDYPAMYRTLFRSVTEAIELLQIAQQKTEEMFIASPPTTISLEQDAPTEEPTL